MAAKCGKCSRLVRSNCQAIRCDTCDIWWHEHCSGVKVNKFNNNKRWDCPPCLDQIKSGSKGGGGRSTKNSSGSKNDRQTAADYFLAETTPSSPSLLPHAN